MFETIVWATDGSELADNALELTRKLAEIHGSRIVVVHANEVFQGPAGGAPLLAEEPEIREKLEGQVEELRAAGFGAELKVRTGTEQIRTLLVRAAEEVDADLIVVGTHGGTAVASAVMGSVARGLCGHSSCPVLVVPPAGAVVGSSTQTTAAIA
jgi:nucleotide-binding universal stress UspA family protein